MSEFYRSEEVTGAKEHKCAQCLKAIAVGERHHYSATKFEGDFNAYREHLDCRKVWLEMFKLREIRWDEGLEFLIDGDDLSEDETWIREEYPEVAGRLFGPLSANEESAA